MSRIIFAVVLIIGAVVIGAGAYQAGLAQGLAAAGQGVPAAVHYGFVPWFGFGFGFLGLLFPILFIFLLFGALRAWSGPRHWGRAGYGGAGPRTIFEEWHREAHGEAPRRQPESGTQPRA